MLFQGEDGGCQYLQFFGLEFDFSQVQVRQAGGSQKSGQTEEIFGINMVTQLHLGYEMWEKLGVLEMQDSPVISQCFASKLRHHNMDASILTMDGTTLVSI